MKALRLISAAELCAMALEPPSNKDVEEAYRRGYQHGLDEALHLIRDLREKGYARQSEVENILAAFSSGPLALWRAERPARFDPPPYLKIEAWWVLREAVFKRDGRVCAFCGSTEQLEIDHIQEVKEGGLPDLENLRVLCLPCNRGRNKKA